MNILVCIKQVPGTSKVEIDEKTGVLKRDGIESKMNPYDLYALETALTIKEKIGGHITVVTMGPNQATSVIKESYMMGADDGYIFSDKKFAGADVLATSYTLSQGIKSLGKFDLIICGKQTTDGDTSQVGPAIAEYLNIPHVTWVCAIRELDEQKIIVEQDMENSFEVVELEYPCLITVEKNIFQPRLPSYKLKLKTDSRVINVKTFNDFEDQNENKYGLNGSATQVERIFPPETNTKRILWEVNCKELVENTFNVLKAAKFI
jgi:electron transfer flavoprotein beta subunit